MSRGNPSYNANKHHGWGPMMNRHLTYEYPSYFVQQHQEFYGHTLAEAPHHQKVRVTEYAIVTEPIKKFGHHVTEENVDKEADDFIKFEHKKFAECKTWK